MPAATLKAAFCVRPATGTDLGGVTAIGNLADQILASQVGVAALLPHLTSVPEIVGAIDSERNDPDDFFITLDTEGTVAKRIWPTDSETVPVRAGQSVAPNLQIDFETFQNISLWDYDTVGRADLLGSITVGANEAGQGETARLAKSTVEGSVYYIVYEVN